MRHLTVANALWLAAYAALMAAIVVGMSSARSWAESELSKASATENWQKFRDDAKQMSDDGPVLRRVPPSEEPPTLRLLRDHFTASLSAALFFSTAVFATTMYLVRGAFKQRADEPERKFADVERG